MVWLCSVGLGQDHPDKQAETKISNTYHSEWGYTLRYLADWYSLSIKQQAKFSMRAGRISVDMVIICQRMNLFFIN